MAYATLETYGKKPNVVLHNSRYVRIEIGETCVGMDYAEAAKLAADLLAAITPESNPET